MKIVKPTSMVLQFHLHFVHSCSQSVSRVNDTEQNPIQNVVVWHSINCMCQAKFGHSMTATKQICMSIVLTQWTQRQWTPREYVQLTHIIVYCRKHSVFSFTIVSVSVDGRTGEPDWCLFDHRHGATAVNGMTPFWPLRFNSTQMQQCEFMSESVQVQ